jgi:galactokinase
LPNEFWTKFCKKDSVFSFEKFFEKLDYKKIESTDWANKKRTLSCMVKMYNVPLINETKGIFEYTVFQNESNKLILSWDFVTPDIPYGGSFRC